MNAGGTHGSSASRPFGVYLHIPFCASKCDYCAFATWTDRGHLVDAYLDAVGTEIRRAVAAGMPAATSVFVGGGTPTLVPAVRLAELISSVAVTADAEITVECNPDDVTPAMMTTFVSAGVNRVSLGVQSMSAHVLGALGRTHDLDNVERAVDAITSAGLDSFNLDLIYGAAGETFDDWAATVDGALALRPPHVSAYGLTVEAGTPLAADPSRHPDDDDQADKYEHVDRVLSAAGLANYEVSNWARPGHESRHNLLYWRQGDYRGFGCAAHSHDDGRRWWNVRTPDRYVAHVESGDDVIAAAETLDDATRRFERLELAMRTRDGIPADSFDERTRDLLDAHLRAHPEHPTHVVLTRRGRLMADEIATRLRA